MGLLAVLSMKDGADIILFTRNSDTYQRAVKRYVATIAQVFLWYADPLKTNPKGTPIETSINSIRNIHRGVAVKTAEYIQKYGYPLNDKEELARNYKLDSKMWKAYQKDINSSKLQPRDFSKDYKKYVVKSMPMNQYMLCMTQFAFIGYPIMFPERVFIHDASDAELESFLHLWAVIGYGLGIDDKYNLGLQKNLKEAKKYFLGIQKYFYTPGLFSFNVETKILLEALFKVRGKN